MATKFTKAKPEQAKFKAGLYGLQGSGKTLTALIIAEGLAKRDNKRIAYIDTEHGTDFYAMDIPDRKVHPVAFDFDRIVTRSIMDTLDAVRELDTSVHGVLVIDSVTHLWEAAREAYTGKRMSNGAIPIQAWGAIKKPYKQLMTAFLDGNFHAILCGREGVILEKDEDGDMEVTGTKMKAEGETAYEPHLLARMEAERQRDTGGFRIRAFFEKDRSGILMGKTIYEPNYATFEPIVRYLSGDTQGKVGTLEDAAERDALRIQEEQDRTDGERRELYEMIRNAIVSAQDIDRLRAAWELTKGKKGKLGDMWDQLEIAKESRKAELMKAVA